MKKLLPGHYRKGLETFVTMYAKFDSNRQQSEDNVYFWVTIRAGVATPLLKIYNRGRRLKWSTKIHHCHWIWLYLNMADLFVECRLDLCVHGNARFSIWVQGLSFVRVMGSDILII